MACRRLAVLAVAAAVAAAAAPSLASAALFLMVSPVRAAPGDRVTAVETTRSGEYIRAWGSAARIDVYLVPVDLVRGLLHRPPTARGVVRLGPLTIDRRHRYAITFTVPHVRPGDYTTAFWCRPCGRTFFASALAGERWAPRRGPVLRVVARRPPSLRRPLHLPKLAPGAPCPVSGVDHRIPWRRANIFGGSGIGRGPVYPGLGSSSGLLWATRDEQYGGPWYGEKVFWYVLPSYRGPILIRGRQLDGPEVMRFNEGKLPKPELRIAPGETVFWSGQPAGSRGVPSGVRVIAPGCYAFQIDGTSFSRIVVVTVDLAR